MWLSLSQDLYTCHPSYFFPLLTCLGLSHPSGLKWRVTSFNEIQLSLHLFLFVYYMPLSQFVSILFNYLMIFKLSVLLIHKAEASRIWDENCHSCSLGTMPGTQQSPNRTRFVLLSPILVTLFPTIVSNSSCRDPVWKLW